MALFFGRSTLPRKWGADIGQILTYRDGFVSLHGDFRRNLLSKDRMDVVGPCCVHGCGLSGHFQVPEKQLNHAHEAAASLKRGRARSSDIAGFCRPATGEQPGVCGTHAFSTIKAHIDGNGQEAKKNTRELTFVHDVIKIANKAVQEEAPLGNRTADEPEEEEEQEEQGEMTKVFLLARPYIPETCFFFMFLITSLKQILHLNRVEGYTHPGEHFRFRASKDGRHVFNFWCVFYTVASSSIIQALRGFELSRADWNKRVGGKFDLMQFNLLGIPSPRQLRRSMGAPFPIKSVVTISAQMVEVAVNVYKQAGLLDLAHRTFGVTFDVMYGYSKYELIDEIDGKCVVVGGATTAELVGAALEHTDIPGEFDPGSVATGLMTVVLHDFAGKHNFLISIIPVHSETGELISEIFLRLRELLFRPHNCYLVFGGGDGTKANVEAWRLGN